MKNINYINAGAGSGKTYTLTKKLAELIRDGETTPSRVILTTFTNRAADEFRLKAREMLISMGLHSQAAELDSAMIGTVHSVAERYIMRYWYLLGLGAGVKPMADEDADVYSSLTLSDVATPEDLQVFGEYAKAVQLKQSASTKIDYDFWKEDVKALIEKAETFSVDDLTSSEEKSLALFIEMFPEISSGDPVRKLQQEVLKRVFRIARDWRSNYDAYKKAHNLVSFNDMERFFIQLLGHPEVRQDIADSVDYVFVDEFQDSNPKQVKIFDMLSEIVGKECFWVGDPKQAIYDFRGCDTELTSAVTNIIEAKTKEGQEGFSYDVLPNSWRSDPELVELVNKAFVPVFSDQLSADKVELNPQRDSRLPADVPHAFHWEFAGYEREDGKMVYAKEYVQQGIAASVCKILQGEHRIKKVYDKETDEIRDVRPSDIAILCDSNSDCDNMSACLRSLGISVTREVNADGVNREIAVLLAVLNYFIDDTSLLDAELSYLLEGTDVCQLMENKDEIRNIPMFNRLDAMKERLRGKSVSYVVSSVIAELDLENLVFKWGNGQARKEVLEAVKHYASAYEDQCLSVSLAATLGGFISYLSEHPVPVDIEIQKEGVNVLTYHKAKGLEWGIVILCSLGKDSLNENTLMKHEYMGVNECRLSPPTETNLYSKYDIRYIPRFLSGNSNPPEPIKNVLRSRPDYSDRVDHVRGQRARLLYVGATRARDYLITVGVNRGGMKWLTSLGINSEANPKSMDGALYHVWAPDAPQSLMEKIAIDRDPIEENMTDYSVLRLADKPLDSVPKFRAPSKDDGQVEGSYRFENVFPKSGVTAERISVMKSLDTYDVFGTCIHNIFAAYQPGQEDQNLVMAQKTILHYGFEQVLQRPSEVIRAADRLYAFLVDAHGKPKMVHHELPFMFVDDAAGQVVTGEMDLVWETDHGCVLVDFKNYPGFEDILDPASKFYVGKYASQMKDYRKALTKAGKTILDTIIYYSVLGRGVRVVEE